MSSPVFFFVLIDVPKPSLLSLTSFMAMSMVEYITQNRFLCTSNMLPETEQGKG